MARRHQRRRTMLLCAVALSALLSGGWWIATGPLLGISHVNVSGYDNADQARVVRTIQISARSGTMLRLPTVAVREALANSPWVEGVEVHHNWPRGVDVRITQAKPAAVAVTDEGRHVIVATSGRVLAAADDATELPTLRVATAPIGGYLTGPARREPFQLLSAMEPSVARKLQDLRVTGQSMSATLADGFEVKLGPPSQGWEKGRALEAMLTATKAQDDFAKHAYIDLTIPSRPMLGGVRASAEKSEN